LTKVSVVEILRPDCLGEFYDKIGNDGTL